jgi:hypothetical protein
LIIIQIRSYFISRSIEESKEKIIVKFTSKEESPKTTNFFFTYYIDGKRIISANSGVNISIFNTSHENDLINNLKLNSFYMADFSRKYPNSIKVNLKKTIKDTVAILNAGFSVKDLNSK